MKRTNKKFRNAEFDVQWVILILTVARVCNLVVCLACDFIHNSSVMLLPSDLKANTEEESNIGGALRLSIKMGYTIVGPRLEDEATLLK